MKTREELINEARRIVHDWHIDRNYDYHLAERIADFALQVLQQQESQPEPQHESLLNTKQPEVSQDYLPTEKI